MEKTRILYVAHGHPDFSHGGGEWAAYHMYQSMKTSDRYEPFCLCRYAKTEHQHAGSKLMRHEADDHVHLLPSHSPSYDYFFHSFARESLDEAENLHQAFRALLEALRPDVIHFHHYIHLGIELIGFARSILPDVKIVLTLHEFLPICAHQGAMIKTGTNDLCFAASPLKCCECFPDRTPGDFFLRERIFKTNLEHVDRFIAPSRFLQNRFVEWGLDADRFLQFDNGRPIWPKPERVPRRPDQPFVAGFFGQVVFHKGVDVFLRAALEYLRRREQAQENARAELPQVRFVVHGTMQSLHDEQLRQTIEELTGQCKDVVTVQGAYDARNMPALLSRVDCVVIPSKWWENSPLVIQEAFMAGVPVICSNIGGMAEKVGNHVNGLHFVTGNHFDLLHQVLELAGSPALYDQLRQGIPDVPSETEMATQMHELYDELTGATQPSLSPG